MINLRVGIAGFGIVGKRRKEVIEKHNSMKIIAVCDQVFRDAGKFDDGINFYPSYSELLNENLDVLFVCLPNNLAAKVTIAGLKKGLHVFCEKPPGRNLKDIKDVLKCHAHRPNQKLKYGFNHRYHDSVKDALELVKSNKLGKIINLRGVYGKSQLITFDQTSWRTERASAGGGVLLDQGIHMVDLLRLFAGNFTDVLSFVSNNVWGYDVEDNAYALMRTEDGIVAMLHSSASQWRHRFSLEISLTGGAITISGILSSSKSYGAETLTITYRDQTDSGDPRETSTRYNHDPSWQAETDEFANAILNDTKVVNGSAQDAYLTMHLVYSIYCADEKWRKAWKLSNQPLLAEM